LTSENIVSYIIEFRKVGKLILVYDFLNASVNGPLSSTDSVMSKFNFPVLLLAVLLALAFSLVEHDYTLAGR